MIIREPKVYLVGRQVVDEAAMAAFLADHGVEHWTTDTEVGGEKLVEVAGRVCFMSFAKPRPGGNRAYIHHILEASHGSVLEHAVFNLLITGVSRSLTHELIRHRAGFGYCLSGDARVYSGSRSNGAWNGIRKSWTMRQLHEWSLDPKRKGRLKLITVRCFDGERFVPARIRGVQCSGVKELHRLKLSSGKEICCSADHRFLSRGGWSPVRDLRVGMEVATNGQEAYKSKEWMRQKYHEENLSQEEIGLLCGVSSHCVRTWVRRHGLQKAMGSWTVGVTPWNKGLSYTAGWNHTGETKEILRSQKLGNKNPSWMGDEASEQAGRLRAYKIFCGPLKCEECGSTHRIHRHHKDRDTLNNDPSNVRFLCGSCHQKLHLCEDGPRHLLIARWDAIESIVPVGVGETYDLEVDHPASNFVANGFVTHNSQLSQRFVDESECDFVEPDVIAEDPDLHRIWIESIQASQAAYRALADRLTEKFKGLGDRTLRRKKAREAARSVLPNATETKIFVTANARALRHFIEMRGNAAADVEIRRLALAVLATLKREAPNLFGDYTVIELPEGGQAMSTAYRKV